MSQQHQALKVQGRCRSVSAEREAAHAWPLLHQPHLGGLHTALLLRMVSISACDGIRVLLCCMHVLLCPAVVHKEPPPLPISTGSCFKEPLLLSQCPSICAQRLAYALT